MRSKTKTATKPRRPAKLYIYNIKYAWDCLYCGMFNVIDAVDDEGNAAIIVECMRCGRKRGCIEQDTWYSFSPTKTKRMEAQRRAFFRRYKKGPRPL